MPETQSVLHNMSAPPKSRLVIAPHRQASVLLTFQLSFVSEDQWQQQLLQQHPRLHERAESQQEKVLKENFILCVVC